MSYKVTILGCGSSGGVPRIGNDWGTCNPKQIKNTRTRCSILVQKISKNKEHTNILIDTAPDLRQQLLSAKISFVDAVLFTHDHADQTAGIDDLRVCYFNKGDKIDLYMDKYTKSVLQNRYDYIFKIPEGRDHPPFAMIHDMEYFEPLSVSGAGGSLEFLPLLQNHGSIDSVGFRVGNFAYNNDLVTLPEESAAHLLNLDVWVVDALRHKKHPTHFNLDDALRWIDRLKPKRTILTNMHVDMDYDTLCKELPKNVEPAYDGMVIEC